MLLSASAMDSFVTQRWVEIEAPLNGARLSGEVRIVTRVHEDRWPVRVEEDAVVLELIIDSKPQELRLTAPIRVCSGLGLSSENCGRVVAVVDQLFEQLRNSSTYNRQVCLELFRDDHPVDHWCSAESTSVLHLDAGSYEVRATEHGFPGASVVPGSPQAARSVSRFRIDDDSCRVDIKSPRHGAVVPPTFDIIIASTDKEACARVDDKEVCGRLRLEALPQGRRSIEVVAGSCKTILAVDVRPGWDLKAAFAPTTKIRLVTAVSDRYIERGMLQNLIGSIHFWEGPEEGIDVYDLGLSETTRQELATWRGVTVRSIADAAASVVRSSEVVPRHLLNASTYSFKPVVIFDALQRHDAVLWLDANVELRRPLDEVRIDLAYRGHFLVQHPYRFPTPQFHHPAALEYLGCRDIPDFSREHCATTIVGVLTGSWFANAVLTNLVDCAATEPTCINPIGSSRANHRQEQTALNAIFCHLQAPTDGLCSNDLRFRLTSDFENDFLPLQPTADETDWNDLVFYTRRDFPMKPYRRFLLLASS